MSKINEDLFTAVDLIVGKRLEEISYDITKPYTIKEVKENGEYIVYDTSIVFTAYSTEDYKVDDKVYVTIPNGDFNSTKIIIGKEKEYGDSGKPYDYISPEEAIIPLETIVVNNDEKYELLANQNNQFLLYTDIKRDSLSYIKFNQEIKINPKKSIQIVIDKTINEIIDDLQIQTSCDLFSLEYFKDKEEYNYSDSKKLATGLKREDKLGSYSIELSDEELEKLFKTGKGLQFNLGLWGQVSSNPNATAMFDGIEYQAIIFNQDYTSIDLDLSLNKEKSYSNYTRLLIKGSFKTLLPINTFDGNYGLKLVLKSQPISASPNSKDFITTTILLDNKSDMIGNIYNFSDYFEQAQIYDISNLGTISDMYLEFYQLGNFKYKAFETDTDGTLVPFTEDKEFGGGELPKNLFVNNVSIALGYDSSIVEGDYVELYTDNIIYDEENKEKTIYLRWAQKQEDGTYKLKNQDNRGLNELIDWFVYDVGETSKLGENWKQIDNDDDSVKDDNIKNPFNITYNANLEKTGDRLRARVTVQKEDGTTDIYTTPTLLLEHRIPVADQATLESTTRFAIVSDDNLNGNYYIYGANGRLISAGEASKPRNIYIEDTKENVRYKYESGSGWQTWKEVFEFKDDKWSSILNPENIISVEWDTIPSDKSMIVDFSNGQYKINSYFTTSKVENNLACTIKYNKRKFYSSTEFKFGIAGSNGSEYTLALSLSNNKNFITTENYDGASEEVRINVAILNSENKEVQIDKNHLSYNLVYSQDIKLIKDTNQLICLKNVTVKPQSGAIVKVTLNKNAGLTNYDLEAYMPVGLATENVGYVIGPTEIIYDSYGKPDYYRGPYQIFTKEHLEEEYNPNKKEGWNTHSWKQNADGTLTEQTGNDSFTPTIEIKDGEKTGRLNASSFYLTNNENYYTISYSDTINQSQEIKWSSPIFIIQNRYPSTTLNKWDGELKMDTENNYILTRAFAAGSKNSENKFTGVVIGDWSHLDTEESLTSETGIYGLKNGAQTFGFKDDGTGFIGPSGKGRILFDGENGTIGTSGSDLYIDFADHKITSKALTIDAKMTPGDSFGNTGAKFYLSNTNNKYFEISHLKRVNNNQVQSSSLIKIGDNDYYLQSKDYSFDQTGTKIDLDAGKITSYGFTLDAKNNGLTSDNNSVGIFLSNQDSSRIFTITKTFDDKTTKKLFHLGNSDNNNKLAYYLQSADYDTDKQTGTKIDLAEGKITSYSFTLDAGKKPTTVTSESADQLVKIHLSNELGTSNYFEIGTYEKKTTGSSWNPSYSYDSKSLIKIGSGNYYLQSKDYNSEMNDGYVTAGIHINLANGNIQSPNFMLTNAIGDKSASLKLKGSIEVTNGGKIGGWSVGETTLYYGKDGSNLNISGTTPGYLINANKKFIVNTNGYLTCYGATLLGGTAAGSSKVIFNAESGSGGEIASVDNFVLENGSYITNKTFRAGMDENNNISNTSFSGGFIFGRSQKKARFGLTGNLNPFIEKTETNETNGVFRYVFAENGNIEYQIPQTEGAADYKKTHTMATEDWVIGKKYATQSWVTDKKYATQSWVTDKKYATQSWVTDRKYLTNSALSGYATTAWVNEQVPQSYAGQSLKNTLANLASRISILEAK